MRTRPLQLPSARAVTSLALVCLGALSGCPAFRVDAGPIVTPSQSLAQPALAQMPPARSYVDTAARFRRDARVGIGGHVAATLVDPRVTAARLAHEAAVAASRPAERQAELAASWDALYGSQRDRFPIDLEWRFDNQFVTDRGVLDPANWLFTLVTEAGRFTPTEATVLEATDAPRAGFWEGRVRLVFPWRDPATGRKLIDPAERGVRLELAHTSGEAGLLWRFGPAY